MRADTPTVRPTGLPVLLDQEASPGQNLASSRRSHCTGSMATAVLKRGAPGVLFVGRLIDAGMWIRSPHAP